MTRASLGAAALFMLAAGIGARPRTAATARTVPATSTTRAAALHATQRRERGGGAAIGALTRDSMSSGGGRVEGATEIVRASLSEARTSAVCVTSPGALARDVGSGRIGTTATARSAFSF